MNQETLQKALLWSVGIAVFVGAPLGIIAVRNAFPPVSMEAKQVSPCTNIKCEEDDEGLNLNWNGMKVEATVRVSPDVIAVSDPSGEKDYTTVTVTGSFSGGTPTFNSDDYEQVGEIEWYLSVGGLEYGTTEAGQRNTWQSSSTLICTMYGTSPGEKTVTGTVKARYFFRKKGHQCDECGGTAAGAKFEEPVPGPGQDRRTVWVVGVGAIQYWHPTDGWQSVPKPLSIPKGQTVQFKAIKAPIDAPSWPAGFPVWEGVDESSVDTARKTFSDVSASNNEADWEKITATCGASTAMASSETANVVVVGVKRIEYANQPVPNPLYVRKDTEVTFTAIPNPEDAPWPDKVYGYPSWSSTAGPMTPPSGATPTVSVKCTNVSGTMTVTNKQGDSKLVPELRTITARCGTSEETDGFVVFDLTLTAERMVNVETDTNKKPKYVVPIMLNDVPKGVYKDKNAAPGTSNHWDCATLCSPSANCADHRELEPVWGLNYADGHDSALENFTLSISPSVMPGEVVLTGGGAAVRLWKTKAKGKTNIITLSKTYAISPPDTGPVAGVDYLPQTFAVEGIAIGGTSFTATYDSQGLTVVGDTTEKLDASVVALVERQGARKIINESGTPISFTVEGGTAFNGKFVWTETNNGSNLVNNQLVPWNPTGVTGSSNIINVGYGGLPEITQNRRFESTVTATLPGGIELTRTVRVAQDGFHGDSVPTHTQVRQRRDQVRNLVTIPNGGMNPLPVNTWNPLWLTQFSAEWFDDRFNTSMRSDGNTVMQYGFTNHGGAFGEVKLDCITATPGSFRSLYVYGAMVFSPAYSAGLKEEDLRAVALHERRHIEQLMPIRFDNLLLNPWKRLDAVFSVNNGPGVQGYRNFLEADAHAFGDFAYSGTSWRLMIHDFFCLSSVADMKVQCHNMNVQTHKISHMSQIPQKMQPGEFCKAFIIVQAYP